MSAEARPISPATFAEAIKTLPLSSLYAKVSELRNSIAHLTRSNEELRIYIRESEESLESPENIELENYILENEGVMQSMAERIGLLKVEVECRGQQWIDEALTDGSDNFDTEELEEDRIQTSNGIRRSHEVNGDYERINGVPSSSVHPSTGDLDSDDEGIHL